MLGQMNGAARNETNVRKQKKKAAVPSHSIITTIRRYSRGWGHKKPNEFDCSGGFALRCSVPVPPVRWSTRAWHMQLKMLANDSNCRDVKMRMGVFSWPWVCTHMYIHIYSRTVAHLFALSYGAVSVMLFPGPFYFNLTALRKCGDYEFLGSSSLGILLLWLNNFHLSQKVGKLAFNNEKLLAHKLYVIRYEKIITKAI